MKVVQRLFGLWLGLLWLACGGAAAETETAEKPFEPVVGQAGRDVVWVPTPQVLVEKMLDLAKVTPADYVMDLGSGDGRNVIAAAKRGARALGVEYNPDMVELSRRIAAKEGVEDKAMFVQGDMYEADIGGATVLALFLLSENLNKLLPKFLALKPGTRIVLNHFGVDGWDAHETARAEGDCGAWCNALLYYVPAKVADTWQFGKGELVLEQKFQVVNGTLHSGGKTIQITNGKLRGDQITFTAGTTTYSGRVNGEAMQGANGAWSAKRVK